jgi:hypothetical protein
MISKVIISPTELGYSHLHIGSPEKHWQALELSQNSFCKRQHI